MQICVFCGSKEGSMPEYSDAATQLGKFIAKRRHGLVYGGAKVGLMGKVADGALAEGGKVTGILPEALRSFEVAHEGLSDFHWASDMHERKAKMESLSDVFIALPGGVGTFEELFEQLTWRQIGIHTKHVVLFNVEGFYDGLISFMNEVEAKGFLRDRDLNQLHVVRDLGELSDLLPKLSSDS